MERRRGSTIDRKSKKKEKLMKRIFRCMWRESVSLVIVHLTQVRKLPREAVTRQSVFVFLFVSLRAFSNANVFTFILLWVAACVRESGSSGMR